MPATVVAVVVIVVLVAPGYLFQVGFRSQSSIRPAEHDLYAVVQAVVISAVLVSLAVLLMNWIHRAWLADLFSVHHRSRGRSGYPDVIQALLVPLALFGALALGTLWGSLVAHQPKPIRNLTSQTKVEATIDAIMKAGTISHVLLVIPDDEAIVGLVYGDDKLPAQATGIFLRHQWTRDDRGELRVKVGRHVAAHQILKIDHQFVGTTYDEVDRDGPPPPPSIYL